MTEKNNKLVLFLLGVLILLTIYQNHRILSLDKEVDSLRWSVSSEFNTQSQQIGNIRYEIIEELKRAQSFVSDFRFTYGNVKDGQIVVDFQLMPKEIRDGELFRVELWNDNDQYPIIVILEKIGNLRYIGSISIPIAKDYRMKVVSSYENTINVHDIRETISAHDRLSYAFHGSSMGSITWKSKQITSNRQYNVSYMPDTKNGKKTNVSDVKLHLEINGIVIESYIMDKIGSSVDDSYTIIFTDYLLPVEPFDEIIIYASALDSRGFNYKWVFEHYKLSADSHMEDVPNANIYRTIIY